MESSEPKSAKLLEAAGLLLLEELKYERAAELFVAAKKEYKRAPDQLRQDLHRARTFSAKNDKAGALRVLRAALAEFKTIPQSKAAQSIMHQIDPPPPPAPKPK